MTAADALIAFLSQSPGVEGVTVIDWRLETVQDEGLRVGIRDSEPGGPYEGPASAIRLGGSLQLHWSDGLVSRGSLDRRAVEAPSERLAAWRSDAFHPRSGRLPPLAGPGGVPAVQTCDPAVADLFAGDPTPLLVQLHHILSGTRAHGARRVDAIVRASFGERTVATSRGFFCRWLETASSVRLWVDELGGSRYERRKLASPAIVDGLAAQSAVLARQLHAPAHLSEMARGVLLMPAMVDALLGRFLLPNLSARAIRDGRSPFTLDDLQSRREILRRDLSLVVDTTLPYEMATAPCSSEGVPAGRAALIQRGTLVAPLADLEVAAEMGVQATPSPRGRPHVLLESEEPVLGLDAALALLGDGVIVRDLPGLHTQPARRTMYALVAPDAQVVRGGAAGGHCAVRLAGNVVQQVSHRTTRLVRINGEAGTGLLVLDGVELLPA